MPSSIKVLGQKAPTAGVWENLYTVPSDGQTVISGFTVANTGSVAARFSLAIRVGGTALTAAHYIYSTVEVPPSDTFAGPGGITCSAADVVSVLASASTLSFSLFGEEVTP